MHDSSRTRVSTSLILIISALLLTVRFTFEQAWNSDATVPEFIIRDLAAGRSLLNWHFSNALFIFPDWLQWFFARSVTSTPNAALIVYALITNIAILSWLLKRLSDRPLIYFLSAFAIWLLVFPVEWRAFDLPVHHGGALVVGLWWTDIMLSPKRFSTWQFIGLLAVAALSTFSDLFFAIWFILPVAITLVFKQRKSPAEDSDIKFRHYVSALSIVVACILFFVFRTLVRNPVGAAPTITFVSVFTSIRNCLSYFIGLKAKFAILIFGVLVIFRSEPTRTKLFETISIPVTLIFVLGLGLWIDSSNARYLMPISFYVSNALVKVFLDALHRTRVAAAVAICVYSGIVFLNNFRDHEKINIFTDAADAACVDRVIRDHQLETASGLATYWSYKRYALFHERGLRLKQTAIDGSDLNWLNNDDWAVRPLNPAFILMAQRDVQTLQKSPIAANSLIGCGDTIVGIYSATIPKSKSTN